ncbi:hypothetical protein [Actinacidiphila oryziradicis]|uniref:hypothetical protein n=1 Tax=Actinacidiphila oryziradicis TaxID=2571141 RepID=UPI001FEC66D4|nr:hypothetical protein [Actinacidiphila oryziradicis]
MTRTLCAVGVLALVFTAVNVTLFATAHGVIWPIALLLDPMVALALAAALLADARLASWGVRPPGWSAALRWGTGLAATTMNVWTSLWPTGPIGWPRRADPAGVLLHAIPPLLLIGLTETVAAYRRRITEVHTTHPGAPQPGSTASPDRSAHLPAEPGCRGARCAAEPSPGSMVPHSGGQNRSITAPYGPYTPDDGPQPPPTTPTPQPGAGPAVDGDLFTRALALDTEHLSRTGQPISIRALREHLHLGQPRPARCAPAWTPTAPRAHCD